MVRHLVKVHPDRVGEEGADKGVCGGVSGGKASVFNKFEEPYLSFYNV